MRHLYYKSITCGSEIISEEGEERVYELKAMNNYKKIMVCRHKRTVAPMSLYQ